MIRWIWIYLHLSDKLDSDPHQFVDDKSKCTEYEPFLGLFQGFEPLVGSEDPDPHPHQSDKHDLDPDRNQIDADL